MWNRLAVTSTDDDDDDDDDAAEADRWIDVARRLHDRLGDLVRDLDDADLARPSACSEWDVAQVLSHLGSAAEISLATLDAAVEGRDAPGPEINPPIWDVWNAVDRRAKADGFLHHSEVLIAAYEALGSTTRAELPVKIFFFPQPVDVATIVRLRTSEMASHEWDVQVAFDPSATLFQPAVEGMVDHSGDFLAFLGHPDALGGRAATVAVTTSDPSRSFALVIDHTVSLADGSTRPDATLRLPAEAWLRLTMGRLAPEHTPAAVSLEGDGLTLDDLRRVFPGT
jgi:uncharacterized protein (TIGR03083 family)